MRQGIPTDRRCSPLRHVAALPHLPRGSSIVMSTPYDAVESPESDGKPEQVFYHSENRIAALRRRIAALREGPSFEAKPDAVALLDELDRYGIDVWFEGDRLRWRHDAGSPPVHGALLLDLRAHRDAVLLILRKHDPS